MAIYNPNRPSFATSWATYSDSSNACTVKMKATRVDGQWKWESKMKEQIDNLPLPVQRKFKDLLNNIFGVWFQRTDRNAIVRLFFICNDDYYYAIPQGSRTLLRQYLLWNMDKFNLYCTLSQQAKEEMIELCSGSHYGVETIYNHMVHKPDRDLYDRFNFDYEYLKDGVDEEGLVFTGDIPLGSMKSLANSRLKDQYGGVTVRVPTTYLSAIIADGRNHYKFIQKSIVEPFEV